MSVPVVTLGDGGSHGGAIASACARHYANNGALIARIGDTYACPIHGPNPIVSGSDVLEIEGAMAALHGSSSACGASMIASATSPEA